MPAAKQSETEVNAVSIRMPPFMESAIRGWFSIIEANFALRNINVSSTKYFHVLSALPPEIVTNISASVLNEQSYDALKNALIQIHERTKPELFARLISKTKMTGRPSYYLQELMDIADKVGVGEDLVKHQFTSALPPHIAAVIAAQKGLPLQQMRTLADELLPLLQANAPTFNVNSNQTPRRNYGKIPQKQESAIPIGLRPFSPDQRPRVCRGHLYFGENSRTCKPWCRWPNKRSCTIQPNSRSSSPAPLTKNQEN